MGILNIIGPNLGFDPRAILGTTTGTSGASTLDVSGNAGLPVSNSSTTSPDISTGLSDSGASGSLVSSGDDETQRPDIVVLARPVDTRVRLLAGKTSAVAAQVLGPNDPSSNILSILYETNGLMFPYTPTINVSQAVNWDPISLIQNNFDVNAYQRTPSVNISVSGVFTAQNNREGEYLMAVLHFLRTVSKSYFGQEDRSSGKAGTPPPVLYFDGYGQFMFNKLACVIKSYSYSFEEGIDTNMFVSRSEMRARLPAKMTISMELGAQVNMNRQRTVFSLDKFRTGELLSTGGWF